MNAVREVPTENRESTVGTRSRCSVCCAPNKALAFVQTCASSPPFAERSEPMPTSVPPRVDLAALTTEATALSREGNYSMSGAGIPCIHELLFSAMELFHKEHSLPSSSTPHNVGSPRASGEQKTAQSASECPRKWNISCSVFSAKVQETHAWRNVRIRFVCTFREAVKYGYTLRRELP